MSQQPLDFQRSFRIVRRHLKLFWTFIVVGLLIGVVYAVVAPPTLSSTALVVLPQVASQSAAEAASGTEADIIDTQVVIAESNPVLSAALPNVSPSMSLSALQKRVQVTSLAGSVVSITASGSTAAQAEATANAVAASYVAYVTGDKSPILIKAKLLQSATIATGITLPERMVIDGFLGALAGALVGFVVALAVGRRDARPKERDKMANSIGFPVLGSFPVTRPSNSAGWSTLLEEYEPEADAARQLRAVLKRLGVEETVPEDGDSEGEAPSVTVVSFASDPASLAVGPQLASFAAAQGIPTALVVGPQQDNSTTSALRTAGTATPIPEGRRRLRILASDDSDLSVPGAARLVVAVAVVDAWVPRVPKAVGTTAAVLAISPGVVTPGQLSRAAAVASADGRELLGILVANPAPGDQSTGKNPRFGQPMRHPLPTRV